MNIKQLLLLVAALTIAAAGFAQNPEVTQRQGGVSVDSTVTCKFTFTSGSGPTLLKFCVTINGNVLQYTSPAGFEHLREGTFSEGYGICDFGNLARYFDWGSSDSGNWQPPSVVGTALPITIKRTTSDGIFTLTQVFSRNTVDTAVNISMTLRNNTAATHSYALVRYADVDANNADGGDFNNWFDFDHQSAWGYNTGFNLFGLMLYSRPSSVPHFAFVQAISGPPDPCSPVAALPSSTPFFGDGSVGLDWNGNIGAGKTVTVIGEYRRF
jgi:hypothetical protein